MMNAIFSGVHRRGSNKQIAFVLAIVVIGYDNDLAASKGGYGGTDTLVSFVHLVSLDLV